MSHNNSNHGDTEKTKSECWRMMSYVTAMTLTFAHQHQQSSWLQRTGYRMSHWGLSNTKFCKSVLEYFFTSHNNVSLVGSLWNFEDSMVKLFGCHQSRFMKTYVLLLEHFGLSFSQSLMIWKYLNISQPELKL